MVGDANLYFFSMSQLAYEETEVYNWPIAMFEIAYTGSQVYSIHIIFDTSPGIFPKKCSHARSLGSLQSSQALSDELQKPNCNPCLARPAPAKGQVACEHW